MKKIQLIIFTMAVGVALGALSSCRLHCVRGSGRQVTNERSVGKFKGIDVAESFKVIVKQDTSAENNVTVTADDNLLKYIRTNVENGVLHIYTKKNLCNSGEMVVKVRMREVTQLKASDASEIVADGKINAGDIHIRLSDGSRITLDINAKHVNTHASDASELSLKGQSSSHDIEMSDGSKIYAKEFVSGSSSVRASDGSNCELNILNVLNVSASDGAVIRYYGNPQSVNSNKSDGASVEKAD